MDLNEEIDRLSSADQDSQPKQKKHKYEGPLGNKSINSVSYIDDDYSETSSKVK